MASIESLSTAKRNSKHRRLASFLLAAAVVASISTGTTVAYAETPEAPTVEAEVPEAPTIETEVPAAEAPEAEAGLELSNVLSAVDDPDGVPAAIGSLDESSGTVLESEDDSQIDIIVGDSGQVDFHAEGNPGFSIAFPDVTGQLTPADSSGTLAFEAGDQATIVPQLKDQHFRGLIVLDSVDSAADYTINISGDEGAIPNIAEDGGVTISSSDGEPIGGFLAPWAKDANNNVVPTHFVADGDSVRQIIDTSALDSSDFPVVADPATYINVTQRYIINRVDHGNVLKWKYLNKCTASKGKPCSLTKTYSVTGTAQGSLGMSAAAVSASMGFSVSASSGVSVTCGVGTSGARSATVYATANRITYNVRTVRTYGVAPKYKVQTKTSGLLTAYKPNGGFYCY